MTDEPMSEPDYRTEADSVTSTAPPRSKWRRLGLPLLLLFAGGALIAGLRWALDPSPTAIRDVAPMPVTFEMRLAETATAPGLTKAVIVDRSPDETIYLHPEIVVTQDDVTSARAIQDQWGNWGVSFKFSSQGGQQMSRTTGVNKGKRLAILIDGEVISAPTINTPVGDTAIIQGDFSQAEAERIAQGIVGLDEG